MKRIPRIALVTVGVFALCSYTVRADVRADEKSKVEFAGMMGRMFNMFGGKAAREGTASSIAVQGDRKATMGDSTGQIIDLSEEKVYDLDLKKKSYKVTTFAELRRPIPTPSRWRSTSTSRTPASRRRSTASRRRRR
jgi:hypothetical protein